MMVEVSSLSWWHVIIFVTFVVSSMWLARRSHSKSLLYITCLVMVLVSGLRHGYVDTRVYRQGFEALDISSVFDLNFILYSDTKDKGFTFLSALIKLFTSNSQHYLLIIAAITVVCFFKGLVTRVRQIDLAIFLLIATSCYLDSMNGMRQALVTAVLFMALPKLIEEKKIWKYIIVVLLASTVHASALIFIPLYFLASKKSWSNYTYVLVGICVILYFLYNSGVGDIMMRIIEGSTYENDYGEMVMMGNTSVNVIRVIISAVPLALAFVNRKYKEKEPILYSIAFNMSVLNFLIWLFATKVLYMYRLAAYFMPYMIMLLCYELDYIKNKKLKILITWGAIICYTIYHIYSLYVMGDTFFVGYMKY